MVMDNPKPTNTLLSIQSRQSYPTKVVVPFASFYSTFFCKCHLTNFLILISLLFVIRKSALLMQKCNKKAGILWFSGAQGLKYAALK